MYARELGIDVDNLDKESCCAVEKAIDIKLVGYTDEQYAKLDEAVNERIIKRLKNNTEEYLILFLGRCGAWINFDKMRKDARDIKKRHKEIDELKEYVNKMSDLKMPLDSYICMAVNYNRETDKFDKQIVLEDDSSVEVCLSEEQAKMFETDLEVCSNKLMEMMGI